MIPCSINIAGYLEQHQVPCFFKSTLGIACPGCGMQRSFIALLRGDLLQSLQYHPALLPLLLTSLLLFVQLKVKHPAGGKWLMWAFIAVAGITLAQYAVKQLMLYHA
jgi:uncharacterized protein DUF2752